MINIDYPNISLDKKTNEQNIQAIKSWMYQLADSLNIELKALEDDITDIKSILDKMEG